jgi:ABC-type sugar transport system ATPase subunit
VRPPDPWIEAGRLSGGNQQKTLFARWMTRTPQVLIVDEPTAGVDVGAKGAIHELIVSLARSGIGVLLISSDLEEVLGLSTRVLVVRRGTIVEEFDGAESREVVAAAVLGTSVDE